MPVAAQRLTVALPGGVLGAHAVGCGIDPVHGIQHLGFFAANRIGSKGRGWLHGRQGQQLEHMVGHHVAQRTRALVKSRPAFNAHGFGHGDLHMINMVAVPKRLKDGVGKAHEHDVLHGLLAQKVVHAVNLSLIQVEPQLRIQRPSRRHIVAKRLLHHHPAPCTLGLSQQAGLAEVVDDTAKKTCSNRQVKQHAVALNLGLPQLGELVF